MPVRSGRELGLGRRKIRKVHRCHGSASRPVFRAGSAGPIVRKLLGLNPVISLHLNGSKPAIYLSGSHTLAHGQIPLGLSAPARLRNHRLVALAQIRPSSCWFRAASLLMIPFASTRPAVRGCQLRNQLCQAIGIIKRLRGGRDL
jgi:hypothetical protein